MGLKTKNYIEGSEFWVDSEDLSFPDLEKQSFVPDKWARYDLLEPQYKSMLIKPINRYVSNLYPKPELISIEGNSVTVAQKTHAEIWVEPRRDGSLYALDKCHQRQFYPSPKQITNEGCFLATYRFYMPWILGFSSNIKITNTDNEFSPFVVEESYKNFIPPDDKEMYVDTPFINFNIKKEGKHMQDHRYGIIDIGSPMFYISFSVTDEQLNQIRKEFE